MGPLIDRVFADHPGISAAVQCAALIVVPDSVADPVGYYRANVAKSLEFVAHLLRNGCERMIFSSSAAIYRPGADLTVDEDSPLDPQSPYARTKAVCEEMFADIAATQPIRVLSLRYFNPIGADPETADRPAAAAAHPRPGQDDPGLRGRRPLPDHRHRLPDPGRLRVSGTTSTSGTWPPPTWPRWTDSTSLLAGTATSTVINLGTGTGTTVRELVDAFNSVADRPIEAVETGRRPGDVAGTYTRSDRARRCLGWQPRYSIAEGIRHSLDWAAIRDGELRPETASRRIRPPAPAALFRVRPIDGSARGLFRQPPGRRMVGATPAGGGGTATRTRRSAARPGRGRSRPAPMWRGDRCRARVRPSQQAPRRTPRELTSGARRHRRAGQHTRAGRTPVISLPLAVTDSGRSSREPEAHVARTVARDDVPGHRRVAGAAVRLGDRRGRRSCARPSRRGR